jgi:hypothetical protein
MSVDYTWSWDDINKPFEIQIEEVAHVLSHGYGGGYSATRPAAQKMQKVFKLYWQAMTAASWLNLVEFWRSVYGGSDAFYFEYPEELYSVPGYGGSNVGDPEDGFDTDLIVGYGEPAIFTCRFADERLVQKVNARFPSHYNVRCTIVEVA